MRLFCTAGSLARLTTLSSFALLATSAFAGSVTITSPKTSSVMPGTVTITASANESTPYHLELWDNGRKLGNYFTSAISATAPMAQGLHVTTVQAVASNGSVLNKSTISFTVVIPKAPTPPNTSVPTTSGPTSTPVKPTAPTAPAAPAAGSVSISSPGANTTSISAVKITASVNSAASLEITDNGTRLGIVPGNNVNGIYVLPNGSHVLTVAALDSTGATVSSSSINYTVAESCVTSRYAQCNLDQLPVNDVQNDCNPGLQLMWVANGCGGGVQGVNPVFPLNTLIAPAVEGGGLPNQGNLSLNGYSVHFAETQGTTHPSNVLFRGQSPTTTPVGAIDTHWVLDQYVYLPDPTAHQAFEIDAQYTAGGMWTKFYTECAFNMKSSTGFWAVFDSETGGWIFLNGIEQNGQTPPAVPCNRSQFSQPWAGSSNPSFTGWHHIAWSFLRNPDATVTYQSLTFDGTTTQINFKPNSASGGVVQDNGNFSALVQLDGVVNSDGAHNVVEAYVSEINLLHTP